MGFWTNIRGIWNPQARAKGYLEAQVKAYAMAKRLFPDRDPNAWLAHALRSRMGWGGRPEWLYHSDTAFLSLAPDIEAPVAMGFFVMFKEEPALAAHYEEQFEKTMGPIYAMYEASPELFAQEWESINPWTAKQFPEVREGFQATRDEIEEVNAALQEGRTPRLRHRGTSKSRK